MHTSLTNANSGIPYAERHQKSDTIVDTASHVVVPDPALGCTVGCRIGWSVGSPSSGVGGEVNAAVGIEDVPLEEPTISTSVKVDDLRQKCEEKISL